MGLFIDDEAVAAKSRLVHVALLNLNLRLMENWRSAQSRSAGGALDYDSLMILMAVIVIAAERVLRADLDPVLQSLSRELPRSDRAKVNLSSIAAATAINRETVRRKVHNLQKAGWLLRDKDGIRVVQGVVPYETVRGIISAQLDALTRIFHQLEKLGIITIKRNQSCAAQSVIDTKVIDVWLLSKEHSRAAPGNHGLWVAAGWNSSSAANLFSRAAGEFAAAISSTLRSSHLRNSSVRLPP